MDMKTSHYWTDGAPGTKWMYPVVIQAIQTAGAAKVLDLGCGNGFLCRRLVDCGFEVVGVDGGRRAIELSSRRVPEARFSVSQFADEPETGFDAVTSVEVIEHLYDPAEMLTYAHKALKPGGIFILTTPYHGYLKNLALSLANAWDKHHMVHFIAGHIKFFSQKTLRTMLERAGFEIASFRGLGRLPYLWKSMMVVAQKPAIENTPR